MGQKDYDRVGVVEVIAGKLYFAALHKPEDLKPSRFPGPAICFNIDNELVYEPFYADFGPLNLGCTYHFCWKLKNLFQEGETHGRCVCFCCSAEPKKKPNAAVLLGAYLVLFEDWDAEAAYAVVSEFEPYLPFRDPTCGVSTYHLSVLDCIRAVSKGKKVGWIDFSNFNVEEYEYFEQVENGDLNWIVPNKLLAFSGPAARSSEAYGYKTLVPEDYVEYFKRTGVTAVIRLNKRIYDKRRFTDHGSAHYDLYFPDGSCPPERIVQRFLEIVEDNVGAVAVHCKAGLGRTGVLIGCYLMKHFRFTANEAIGYLRIVRPGSVIGPQQHFLRDMQSRMWKSGDAMRRRKSDTNQNSKQYLPSFHPDSRSFTSDLATSTLTTPSSMTKGASVWNHGKGSFLASRSFSTNPVIRKGNTDNSNKSRRDSSPCSSKSSSFSQIGNNRQGSHPEEEVNSGYRSTYFQAGGGGLYTKPNNGLHRSLRSSLTLGSNSIGGGSSWQQRGGVFLATMEPASSCSNDGKRQNWNEARSDDNGGKAQFPGILRNASLDGNIHLGDGGVFTFTQRTINSAGQPRKVPIPVPVSQVGGRENSPGRRRSTSVPRSLVV